MKYLLKSGLNRPVFRTARRAGEKFEQNRVDFARFRGLEQV
jgi:hypothetical protein